MRLSSVIAAAVLVATPVVVQAADVTPLVTAEWLKAHAADENVVVVDIRDKIDETDLGDLPYIAHAVVAPYASYGWRTEVEGVPGQIPPTEQIAALIGGLGIDSDDHVVIVPWARILRNSVAPRGFTGPSSISATTRSPSSMAAGASMMPSVASASPSR